MPTGKIQPEFVERLQQIGAWTSKNGESIYGTRGGPVTPRPWGVTTQTTSKVYVHVLDWQDNLLALPSLGNVTNARLLNGGASVPIEKVRDGVLLRLPKLDSIDTIVVLDKT
jgi:alpha-L-fucosidase